jgi:hypothetical protein
VNICQYINRMMEVDNSVAYAYLTVEQAGLASGAATKVNLVESYDIGGNFASNKYTVPVTGYYHVSYAAYMRDDGGAVSRGLCYLYVDGAAARYGSLQDSSGDTISTGSSDLYLTAGQYLELYALAISADTWKIAASAPGTFMSVHLIARA